MTGTNAMEILPVLIVPAAIMLPPVVITAMVLRYRRVRTEMRYRLLLQLAEACESSDDLAFDHSASVLQLTSQQINWAHLQALAWCDQITQ